MKIFNSPKSIFRVGSTHQCDTAEWVKHDYDERARDIGYAQCDLCGGWALRIDCKEGHISTEEVNGEEVDICGNCNQNA